MAAEEACNNDLNDFDEHSQAENEDEDRNEDPATAYSNIEEVRIAQQFIEALEHADIYNGDLSVEAVEALLHPPEYPLELDTNEDIDLN
ncbi:hypothetical protein C0992_005934, partial [Termitomyces sp. T32_za158]